MGLNRKTMDILNILLICIGLAGYSINGGSVDVVVEKSETCDCKEGMNVVFLMNFLFCIYLYNVGE